MVCCRCRFKMPQDFYIEADETSAFHDTIRYFDGAKDVVESRKRLLDSCFKHATLRRQAHSVEQRASQSIPHLQRPQFLQKSAQTFAYAVKPSAACDSAATFAGAGRYTPMSKGRGS